MPAGILEFGEFQLDCDRFEFRRKGVPLRLERKPLELLILLASSGGRLVTRDEIARCLWPSEVFVDTEHGINTAVRKIRYALRENPERPCFLETVTGKGYRFIGVAAPPQPAAAPRNATPPPQVVPQLQPEPQPLVPARAVAFSRRRIWISATILATLLVSLVLVTAGIRRVQGRVAGPGIDPLAMEAYQRGRFLWFSHEEESGAYFLKATELAPQYAPGWAGLANYYGAEIATGGLDPRGNLPLVDASAHRAIQLDDTLPESHLALGAADWIVSWDFPSALKELDRAIQLDPKFTEAHHLRAKLLGQLNRHEEAIAEQRLAMQLNPFERPWGLACALLAARRYDDAAAEARMRLQGTPNDSLWDCLSLAYAAKGMQKESEDARERSFTLSGDPAGAGAVHRAFTRGGRHAVLLWMLGDLQSQSQKHYVSPYRFAQIYAGLGEKQQALDALEETVRQHSTLIFYVQTDFVFDSLHADPRYRTMIRRIGLPPSW